MHDREHGRDDDQAGHGRQGAELPAPDPGEIGAGVRGQRGHALGVVTLERLVGAGAHIVAPLDSAGESPRSPERPAVISSTTWVWVTVLRRTWAAIRPR